MRVVLDTNILVSALIAPAGNPAAIYNAWEQGKFTLLTCAEHLDELRATLQKPRVAELIKPYKAGRLVNHIRRLAEDIGQLPQVRRSPDPADNFLLALAEAATRITSSPATKAACWRSPVTSPLASSPRATSPPCSQNRLHESRFSSTCDSPLATSFRQNRRGKRPVCPPSSRRLLFLLCRRSRFARRGNNVLEPHVCDQIAVVFHVMRVVNVQHTEFGHIHAEQLHHLRAGRIRHAVISFVTVGERTFERGNEIGFRGLGLLDFEAGIRLPECQRAKIILGVRDMPHNLAVAADGVSGLEVVVLFGHFFSGTDEDGFHPCVEDFIVRAERTL